MVVPLAGSPERIQPAHGVELHTACRAEDPNRTHMPPVDANPRLLEVIRTQTEIARLGHDLGSVMDLVAERTQQLTGADGAVVELAEDADMVYRAATGSATAHLGMRLARDNSLSGLCIAAGAPLNCVDSETDPRVNVEACRKIGLRSMIVVPLHHHNTVVGVLKVLSSRPNKFDDDDLHLLGLMSGLIAAAMFHATRLGASELFIQATHDALTGLPNRALFFERLHLCLAQARRENRRFGVLNLDMDGLKQINDNLGHRAGDAALQAFATRLRQCARAVDTVARVGGDEFAVILSQVDSRDVAATCVQRYADAIRREGFAFENTPLPLDASIGQALYPDDAEDLASLLDRADQAMYATKRAKKAALAGA
ncbi:MAG TPA: sensor domain-containing diguanylate cyclase [Lysobacter sp.]|nr:sensor domain-containing diguanylate cyclase [Lysobacter sp.]